MQKIGSEMLCTRPLVESRSLIPCAMSVDLAAEKNRVRAFPDAQLRRLPFQAPTGTYVGASHPEATYRNTRITNVNTAAAQTAQR